MSRDLGREARRSRRHRLPGSPPVYDLLAERVLGRAIDMSAGGLKLLVADHRLRARMGANGRDYVRNNYRWDVIIGKYERMFTNLKKK